MMERQREYEIRNKIADAINEDVERVFKDAYKLLGTNFIYKFLIPLSILEIEYKKNQKNQ